MPWRVRAIRGATTALENSVEAIREAVNELLDQLEVHNKINLEEVVSVTFSVTRDLNAVFPAAIARERPHWSNVPLLDVQQMHVEGDLNYCIRCLIHFNTSADIEIYHPYLRRAETLRPDRGLSQTTLPSRAMFQKDNCSLLQALKRLSWSKLAKICYRTKRELSTTHLPPNPKS